MAPATGPSRARRTTWQVVSTVSGLLAAMAAHEAITWVWTRFVGTPDEAPPDPADRRVDVSQAVIWAVAAGIGGGLARLLAERVAAAGWEAATGEMPPGVEAGA